MSVKKVPIAKAATALMLCVVLVCVAGRFFRDPSSPPEHVSSPSEIDRAAPVDPGEEGPSLGSQGSVGQEMTGERGKDASTRIELTELDGRSAGDCARLGGALKSAGSAERFLAVQQLEKIGTKEALEALAVALGDEELSVSTSAAAAITRLCGYQPDSYRPVTAGARSAQVRQFQSWLSDRKKFSLSEMKLEALKERSKSRD